MRILGVLISLVIIGLVSNLAGSISMFIDIPSLLLVLAVAAGAVIGRHGFSGFGQMWQKQDNEQPLYTFSNAALMAGLIGTMLAMVALLSFTGPKHVGPSIAVSLLSSLYGIVLYPLCYTLSPKFEVTKGAAVLLLANVLVGVISFAIGLGLAVSQAG